MTHHTHPSTTAYTHAVFQDDRMAAVLEAEGQLVAGLTDQAVQLCAELLDGGRADVRRLADLGCGPGVATIQLAEAFDEAMVVGVDGSPVMLERAAARAAPHGASSRVELRSVDLNADLRKLGTFDLVWAALALHHTDDEPAALTRFGTLLRPRGLICLLERADPTVVRPANDLGRPGIWDRVETAQSAWYQHARRSLPGVTNEESYAGMLEQAGLDLLVNSTLADTVMSPVERALQPVIHRYVRDALRNLRDILDAADFDALTDADERATDIAWGDALVTSTRTLFIARQTRSDA